VPWPATQAGRFIYIYNYIIILYIIYYSILYYIILYYCAPAPNGRVGEWQGLVGETRSGSLLGGGEGKDLKEEAYSDMVSGAFGDLYMLAGTSQS